MSSAGTNGGGVPEGTPDVGERTGETVEEAVDVAAAGSRSGGAQRPPEDAHSGAAPVEQVRDDPAMTGDDDEG